MKKFTALPTANEEWPWLEGRGGDSNGLTQVVAITAPGRETLYANPEGYSYARYIGTAQPEISFHQPTN